jgi:uncharacterized membrane protein YphA (DoxX/SURF4 family)
VELFNSNTLLIHFQYTKSLESGRLTLQNLGIRDESEFGNLALGVLREWGRHPGRKLLVHLFSAFPRGWPGAALLLLRAVIGLAMLAEGGFYFSGSDSAPATWLIGLVTCSAGGLLLIGFLTPIVAMLAAVATGGIGFSLLPLCSPNLFDSKVSLIFGCTMLVAVMALGPGAFSVDARVFGRREIIIPPSIS